MPHTQVIESGSLNLAAVWLLHTGEANRSTAILQSPDNILHRTASNPPRFRRPDTAKRGAAKYSQHNSYVLSAEMLTGLPDELVSPVLGYQE